MSADTKTTKKRKSGDDVVPLAKKVKTTTTSTTRTTRSADAPASSAEAPAPLKSALKKKDTKKPLDNSSAVKVKKEKKSEKKSAIPDTVEESATPGSALTAAETDAIFAGFTDSEDEDAAEEEDALINVDTDAIDIAKLPAAPKPKAGSSTSTSDPESTPGVVYISRIPHGFYEPQMTAYFSQFGPISALRLARNRKTGKSQHFAFILFESASVADIVARTMDKYLLFGHLLQARTVPMEQVKEGLFDKKKSGGKGGKVRPRNRIEGGALKRGADREAWGKRVGKEEKRRKAKEEQLKKIGYEFEMPLVKGVESVAVKENQRVLEGGSKEADEGKVGGESGVVQAKDVVVDEVEEKKIEEQAGEEEKEKKKVVVEKKEKRKAKGGDAPKKKKARVST